MTIALIIGGIALLAVGLGAWFAVSVARKNKV